VPVVQNTAFFDQPLTHELYVGVSAMRWIDNTIHHMSAGFGVIELAR
jgi:hypothetical protein